MKNKHTNKSTWIAYDSINIRDCLTPHLCCALNSKSTLIEILKRHMDHHRTTDKLKLINTALLQGWMHGTI